jgi:hypothetical protein
MNKLGNSIDDIIKETVNAILNNREMPDTEYIATDNLGEVIEKLIIIHIRMWMLEDAIQGALSDSEIADLKKKCDICFKIKRPKLVQAVNLIVNDAIINNKSLLEDSVKLYKGIGND